MGASNPNHDIHHITIHKSRTLKNRNINTSNSKITKKFRGSTIIK